MLDEASSTQPQSSGFVEFPPLSPYVALNGPVYARVRDGDQLELGFVVQPKNTNLNGHCHGAVLFSLLDSVMGASILYSLEPEYSVATLNLSSNFLGAARVGELLIGRAVIDGCGKSHLFASGSLSSSSGIVATATGTFSKIRNRMPVTNFRELVKALLQPLPAT